MANFTLRQLRYFEALAQHGHFGRAAQAAAISQPALSVQIKELETALGVTLFERGARQVRLTSFGEAFGQRVREILRQVDELGELARLAQSQPVGRLRIGVIPTVAPYYLPGVIQALQTAYQGIDLHVRETLTPRLLPMLLEGRLDCAIVALPVSEPALHEEKLFEEAFVLVRPRAEAATPVPEAAALASERLLLLEEGHCFRDQALSVCGLPGRGPRDGLEGSSLSTLVQMVGAGIGVTLIPEMAAPVEARSAAVALSRLPPPEPARTIGMVWRRASPLAGPLRQIAEVLRDVPAPQLSALAAGGGGPSPITKT